MRLWGSRHHARKASLATSAIPRHIRIQHVAKFIELQQAMPGTSVDLIELGNASRLKRRAVAPRIPTEELVPTSPSQANLHEPTGELRDVPILMAHADARI